MYERQASQNAIRILVVEDEQGIANFLQQGLIEAGYAVDRTADGVTGLSYALARPYDAIVLDIQLPGLDGLGLLNRLRGEGHQTPVLLLTARNGVNDRVAGLDGGADDYLSKPFAFPELLARLRALLRRAPLQTGVVLQVADLVLDTTRREARRGVRKIELSPREWSLLEYLMRHSSQVLTRTQLAEHVWDVDFYMESNVVDVYIGYLRRKVDRGDSPPLIHTVRGMGYRIAEEGNA